MLFPSYVSATSWDHLARAVRHSASRTKLDEMIELWDASKGTTPSRIFDVRRVFYETISDIPALLRGEKPTLVPVTSSIPPQIPSAEVPTESGRDPASEEVDPQPEDPPFDEEDAGSTQMDDGEDMEDMDADLMGADDIKVDTEEHGMAHVEFTEDEKKAAHIIQQAYRAHAARLESPRLTASQAIRQRIVSNCFKVDMKVEWPDPRGYYRKLFRGPLPHLLVCLEGMKDHFHAEKKRAAKRTQEVQHEELDAAMERQREMT